VLWTDDVPAAYAELVEAGVPGLRPPGPWLESLVIAGVADPDGNPVQLVSRPR
jgi:glyoxylase I family protein